MEEDEEARPSFFSTLILSNIPIHPIDFFISVTSFTFLLLFQMRTPKKAPIVELDSEGNEYLKREDNDDTFSIEMVDTIFTHILTVGQWKDSSDKRVISLASHHNSS